MLKNFVKGVADAIRRKEGSTDLISPMDFAQRIDNLQVGGGTDGVEEKVGMTYVTKEALFTALETPTPESMTQEELRDTLLALLGNGFPVIAFKGQDGDIWGVGMALGEELNEGRFTYDKWVAVALNWDALSVSKNGIFKSWQIFGVETVAEARVVIAQVFPQQLTETEFFGDTTT